MKERPRSFSLLTATFIGTLDSNAMVPIIYLYARSLGSSLEMAGLIVAMYSIVHVPANIVFGRIADKIGRRIPFIAGLSWDAFSVFLYTLTANPWHLLLVRFSHGLGGGFVGPSSMAIAANLAPEDQKGRMMAKYGIALALSVIVGFALSGILIEGFGYNVFFYVLSGLLIIAVFFASQVREPESLGRVRSTFKEDVKILRGLLKRKPVIASYASVFSLYFVMGTFTVLVPHHMRELGMETMNIVAAFSAFAVLSVILHYPSGILSDRFGPKYPAIAGLLTITLAMILLPFFSTLTALILVSAIFGVGHGLVFPSSSTMVVRASTDDVRGLASGTFYALLVAGVAVGAPIATLVAGASTTEIGMWSSAIISVLCAIYLVAILRKGS